MKLRRLALLVAPVALTTTLFLSGTSVRAQESSPVSAPAPTPIPTPGQPTETVSPTTSHGESEASTASAETGHPEEEERGPKIALFGKPLDKVWQFLLRVVNFAIFFSLLYFILKGALSSAFKARANELEEQLAQAGKDKAEGEAQMKELEARMAGMQQDLEGIMAKSEADAETEKQRILEAARAEASQILAQAQAEIQSQQRLAEKKLRTLVAELAIEGAAKRLEYLVQGKTAEAVLDMAIDQVGAIKGGVK